MPTFLSDPSTSVYLLVGVGLIISIAVWVNNRSRNALIATLVFGLLLGLIYLTDFLVESPREQAVRKMKELAVATQGKNYAEIPKHFSEQFRYGGTTKKQVADQFQRIRAQFAEWQGGEVWQFDRENFEQVSDTQLKLGFTGAAKGRPESQHYIVATYQKEADGEWRIVKVAFYDPLQKDRGGEKMIPQLGN